MEDCIFCKIAAGEIPAEKLYEDEDVIAIRDIEPKAPVHVLVIPRRHVANLNELGADDQALAGKLFSVAASLAETEKVAESGYRLVLNSGPDSGQEVAHAHVHLLGRRGLGAMG